MVNKELFSKPDNRFRAKPFWAWNGKLEKEELLRQLRAFQEMGMGGTFFHSRTGLITKYLGDEWFELINLCADTCAEMGLESWLYDEDRWPSGTAGGEVTKRPEYRMHYLALHIGQASEFRFSGEVLAAFEVDLDGLAFTEKKRLAQEDRPRGTVVWFSVEEMESQSTYNGTTYVDTMNREATDRFIDLTHRRYSEQSGERLGNSIRGIFTDEPHRGAVMCSFAMYKKDMRSAVPYTPLLFEAFRSRFGYELEDHLPELFLHKDGQKRHPVKWQYMELTQTLFLENFMKPVQEWCRANGILLTGHVLHEDTLTNQACMIGSVMRAYEYMDIPGIDILGEYRESYWVAVQLRSAARQLEKRWLLSELYGCTGWQFGLRSHKTVGDWQALFGVNIRCPHLSWYTMRGEAKRDYPASIFMQSAWYRDYRCIEDYFARFHLLMMQGEPLCDTLVINPVESAWAVIYPGWSGPFMETLDEDVKAVEAHFEALFHVLAGARIDFDYGDEHFLWRHGAVESRNGQPVLRVGAMAYKTVVVPHMLTVRASTVDLLEEFARQGGRIVFSAPPPAFVDAAASGRAIALPGIRAELSSAAAHLEPPFVEIGPAYTRLFAQVRRLEDGYVAALLNTDPVQGHENVRVRMAEAGDWEQWDIRTGEIRPLGFGQSFELDFAPSQEYLLRMTRSRSLPDMAAGVKTEPEKIAVKGPFRYSLQEENICVLDMARFCVNGKWHERTDVLLADRVIRRELGLELRGGEMYQPWFTVQQGHPVAGQVELLLDFTIEHLPKRLKLAMETPEEFQISLNGHDGALSKTGERWVDNCYTVFEVDTAKCVAGCNELKLAFDMRDDVNIESLFLLGDFGVRLENARAVLAAKPQMLEIGDVGPQGFPFYSAGITYEIPDIPEGITRLEIPRFEAALVKIKGGGREHVMFAPPYTADIRPFMENGTISLEYVFTRKNTFGPLHYKPVQMESCGPNSFVIEDEELILRDGYGLIEQGMMSPVYLF